MKSFDPRAEPDAKRVLGGTYTVSFPQSSAVDLAIDIEEKWNRSRDMPRLSEQAVMWHSAALAFSRLRPDQRQATRGLYEAGEMPLLPKDAHLLPLIFLPGLQALLADKFIDVPNRTIRNALDPSEAISLRTTARFGRAALAWSLALDDLSSAGLPDAQLQRLAEAPEKLKDALRLAVLTILRSNAISTQSDQSSLADVAEAIVFVADAEQFLLPSPLLKAAVIGAFHRFAAVHLAPIWGGSSPQPLQAQDALWAYLAVSAVNRYPATVHEAPWLPALLHHFEKVLGQREVVP